MINIYKIKTTRKNWKTWRT